MSEPNDRELPEKVFEKRLLAELTEHPEHSIFDKPTDAEIEMLARDISERGLQFPIEITPDGQILVGRRRCAALQLLGNEDANCLVRYDVVAKGPDAVANHVWMDNVARRSMSPMERARVFRERKLTFHRSSSDDSRDLRDILAEEFGMSGGSLDRLCRILDAPRPVQDAFERGKLRLVDAAKVRSLPPHVQTDIAGAILRGKDAQEAFDQAVGRRDNTRATPTNLPESPAMKALRELTVAVGALFRAADDGCTLSPMQRQNVIFAVRRLREYLRRPNGTSRPDGN